MRKVMLAAFVAVLVGFYSYTSLAEVEHYSGMQSAPAQYLHNLGIGSASSTDLTAPVGNVAGVTSYAVLTRGNPTLAVSVENTTASATQAITVVLWHQTNGATTWSLAGVQTATATAGAVYTTSGSEYPSPMLFFDLGGATYYEIRAAAPSAGTASINHWAYGVVTK